MLSLQGYARAQLTLGELYLVGADGVKEDLVQARRYLVRTVRTKPVLNTEHVTPPRSHATRSMLLGATNRMTLKRPMSLSSSWTCTYHRLLCDVKIAMFFRAPLIGHRPLRSPRHRFARCSISASRYTAWTICSMDPTKWSAAPRSAGTAIRSATGGSPSTVRPSASPPLLTVASY